MPETLQLVDEMQQQRLKPNAITYTEVVSALERAEAGEGLAALR